MRFECELSFEIEAPDMEEAEIGVNEVWSALDWTLVPEGLDASIGEARVLRALP